MMKILHCTNPKKCEWIELQAKRFSEHHMKCTLDWNHGQPVSAWYDDDFNICIKYKDGTWWHYLSSADGAVWW